MDGATMAVSTFMLRCSFRAGAVTCVSFLSVPLLRGCRSYEVDYALVDQLRLLPYDEVARVRHAPEGEVCEEVAELVAPGHGEYRVVLGPEDERWGVDLQVAVRRAAGGAEGGAVAVEAAAQRARL